MRMYKPQEIADRMIREAVPLETDFCLAADVAALREAQRQLELRLLDQIEKLTRERDETRAERDTLLLDARDFLRWFNRHYPEPSGHPDHPWRQISDRLNAHADTLATFDSGVETKEEGGQ